MSRRKIAPTVEWFVNEAVNGGGSTLPMPGTRDDARRELRALTRQARIVNRLLRENFRMRYQTWCALVDTDAILSPRAPGSRGRRGTP